MKVELFVSCLVDQMWPQVGMATVALLERAGCTVRFDPRQTCCGQPAYNTGYRDEARSVATCFLDTYARSDAEAIVVPSGSCAAMIHHLPELFAADPDRQRLARELAGRTHELATFLTSVRPLDAIDARFEGRVTWHDACHGLRDLGVKDAPRALLAKVAGLELVELASCESCCGFGGTFSVKVPDVSLAMADHKIDEMLANELDAIVSGDVSCLMQLEGRLRRRGSTVRVMHLAEVLTTGGVA